MHEKEFFFQQISELKNNSQYNLIVIEGKNIYLTPLNHNRDAGMLFNVSNGSEIRIGSKFYPKYDSYSMIWKYMNKNYASTFQQFFKFITRCESDGVTFCIYDKEYNHAVGIIGFIFDDPYNKTIEIGNLWVSPIAQGTGIAFEAGSLLINYAFSAGYERIEWVTNKNNIRSQKLAMRLGFVKEIFLPEQYCKYKNIQKNDITLKIINQMFYQGYL